MKYRSSLRAVTPLPPHTSEGLPASTCLWKRHALADETQIGAEDRPSSRHRCRHSSARENRRTTSGDSLPALLRSFGRHPSPHPAKVACHPKPVRAKGGGAGGIRTLDRALQPYNGLANRRLQPLGHSSVEPDMPDAGVGRKRQISGCRIRKPINDNGTPNRCSQNESLRRCSWTSPPWMCQARRNCVLDFGSP